MTYKCGQKWLLDTRNGKDFSRPFVTLAAELLVIYLYTEYENLTKIIWLSI